MSDEGHLRPRVIDEIFVQVDIFVAQQTVRQELESNGPIQPRVLGLIAHANPGLADLFEAVE